jgi:ABC-type amino acid transport substrate-binding protein
MAGLTVGVQRGTTYQAWAQQNLVDTRVHSAGEPWSSIRLFADMFTDLRTGKLDVALMGKLTADVGGARTRLSSWWVRGSSAQQFAIAAAQGQQPARTAE